MTTPRHHTPRSGFTLVETLVAMGVFALALASLMPLVVSQVRATDEAGLRTQALAISQKWIENYRTLPFSVVESLAPNQTRAVDEAGDEDPNGAFVVENWIAAAPGPASTQNDMKRITVQTRWALSGGRSGSVTLATSRVRY